MIRFLVFLLVLTFTTAVHAQFKNIKIGEDAANAEVVINPRNPKMMAVVSASGAVHYTHDGGLTWLTSKLGTAWGIYGDVSLLSDNKGNFYAVYASDESGEGLKNEKCLDHIICQVSKDGGATWEEGNPVATVPGKDQFSPHASVDDKGNIYVTWTQLDKYPSEQDSCTSVIMFSQSSNGKKWNKPVVLSQLNGNCSDNIAQGATPAVDTDGRLIFVTWANQRKIFLDRSFNGGDMWLRNDINITDQPKTWKGKVSDSAHYNELPRLIIDGSKTNKKGSLYMIWSDARKGATDTDIWFMRSTNLGDNWTPVTRLNDDEPGAHQYHPAMVVDPSTGYIYAAFLDRRNYKDNQTDVYLAYSTDAGHSFKNVKISESPFLAEESVSFANKISISAAKGIITPAWTRTENGKTSLWITIINQADLIKTP